MRNGHRAPDSDTEAAVPTVSRVCSDTLIELVYDGAKRKTALAVSRHGGLWNLEQEVRIETGEVLVPYSAKNNLIASGCVLLPERPEEYGFRDELVGDIRSFLHRYVDLSPAFETVAAYYVLLSWVHDAFNELPYLRLRGEYGTGKSRGLLTIGSLCYRPFFASGASTISPIFHTLDSFGGTLVLDEADFQFSDMRSDIVKLLNNGTVRGIPVLRSVMNRNREFNPHAFQVFGPKLIAMRGSFEDDGLESRFITENTGRRPLRGDVPIHLPDSLKTDALALRNWLLHFRLCHFYEIKTNANALIPGAEPRLNQTALSLLSLIDDADDRALVQAALVEGQVERDEERQDTAETAVLAAVYQEFNAAPGNASLRSITDRFNGEHCMEYGAPVSNRWVGHILRSRLRIKTRKTGGVYVVPVTERPVIEAVARRHGIVPLESGNGS